uniref:Craniofacial development protein 2 n=1 Tax=Cacopsylla melanoneura TaxID=428564 RepID=A0A8D8Z0H2_9HEMI
MAVSLVNSSGSKLVRHSDFRARTTTETNTKLTTQKRQKNIRRIGTWNVQTLLKAGKLENLKIEMRRQKLDILGISEMRWNGTGDFWSEDYRIIYSGPEEERTGINGVGIVLEKALGLRVTGYVQHSDRIIMVKIKTEPNDTIIIQLYMPTSGAPDEEIEKIYDEVNKLIDTTKADDNIIILGDMNAIVGEGREGTTVGQYGHGRRNERGNQLIEFCTRNNLVITNTLFMHHKRRRHTWIAPGDIRREQLDYIMVKKRFKNQVKNCRSHPGADIGSDHNLVMMHSELKYKKLTKKNRTNIEVSKLKNIRIRQEYKGKTELIVNDQSIEDLQQKPVDEQWKVVKEGILKTANELLKDQNESAKKPWITEEIVDMIEERRKWKSVSSDEGKATYRRLKNEIVSKCRRAKEEYMNGICEEIDTELKVDNLDKAYGMVKKFFGEKKNKTTGIQDEKGQYLYDEEDVARRWKEYLEKLYGNEDMDNEVLETEQLSDPENQGEPILREEFDKALKDLKCKKAPGIDGIQAELLKECGDQTKHILYSIVQKIYDTGIMPTDFTQCIIIPIPKKARAKSCDQYRTLSLTSHASKILTRIILKRIETNIDNYLTEDQFGFRRGMGTREAILTLRQIIEKRNRKGKTTFLSFVDLEKAFDNVNWDIMFGLLKKVGISYKDRRIIHSLYKNEVGVVRIGEIQEEANIKKGVRQGCSLSPYLFNLYVQEAINKIREETEVGVKIHGERIDMLRFADDIAITTETEEDLQLILQTMNNVMKNEFNMRINKKKTKILLCNKNKGEIRPPRITIDHEIIECVTEYKYLGSLTTQVGNCKKEIISNKQTKK